MSGMKEVRRARWLATFDMESLLSSIMQNGMVVSMGLIVAALAVRWMETGGAGFGSRLQANSIPSLILADLQEVDSPEFWPRLLIHLSVVALLLIPYVRVFASMVYFAAVERDRKHVWFTGFVLAVLTVVLFTTLV